MRGVRRQGLVRVMGLHGRPLTKPMQLPQARMDRQEVGKQDAGAPVCEVVASTAWGGSC